LATFEGKVGPNITVYIKRATRA